MTHREICEGCPKSNQDFCCSVYHDPTKTPWIRFGEPCPFNPKGAAKGKKKFVNPIKASKRRNS